MKKRLLAVIIGTLICTKAMSQDVPVYSQKLTNSFLYNASVAGNTLGSITLSYRQQWTGATGAPQTSFFSFHTPFNKHRFGTGFNMYSERAGVLQNLYTSAAFAYHIRSSDTHMFSMGLSAEYLHSRIDYTRIDALDMDDALLQENQDPQSRFDFSFGLSFQSKYMKLGVSANRITDLVGIADSLRQFPAFYSGFINFTLPVMGGRDLIEPLIYVRHSSSETYHVDGGMYYTFNNRLTLGGSYRTGGAIAATGAFRITKGIHLGYSREILSGKYASSLGASNEFTLRFDFRDHNYYSNPKNAKRINTSALALRRKTLKQFSTRNSPYRFTKHNGNFTKKNYLHSPNYRMESSRKLMTKKPKNRSRNGRRK